MHALEDHYWWFVARRNLALRLLDRHADLNPNSKILDLGCGTGVVLGELTKRAVSVGFDFSPEALRFCTARELQTLVLGDGHHLPFAENSFDAIVSLDVFEHLEFDEMAFAQAFQSLKSGGILVASVPAFKFLWGPHDVALMHFRRYTKPELRRKLESTGFKVEKISYSVYFLFPLVYLIRLLEKGRKGPAHASLPSVPEFLNRFLIWVQGIEASVMQLVSLPWGSSVVIVARKPKR